MRTFYVQINLIVTYLRECQSKMKNFDKNHYVKSLTHEHHNIEFIYFLQYM